MLKFRSLPLAARFLAVLILAAVGAPTVARTNRPSANQGDGPPVLWRAPENIATRDLFYGPGGKDHAPTGTFTFESEDINGSNPKFQVVDQQGVRWTVKMGEEVRPEIAASRIVWAVGYFTNEDYFLPALHVENMQPLSRGGNLVSRDGTVKNVRLKRHLKEQTKLGNWYWADNPFTDTRELYGLRVLMALINNWDLKDTNNSIYQIAGDHPEQLYIISDLGSSFGSTGLNWQRKGTIRAYSQSKMISRTAPDYVDFTVPARPKFDTFIDFPELRKRLNLRWLGQHIPTADAKWMGQLLAQLSPAQIRDAFRAAGYSAEDIESFSSVVEDRINQLKNL
jgi:hypothetical protein